MTVYVDNVQIRASVGRFKDRVWCHLLSDDPTHTELHALAQSIGLRRSWFQPPKAFTFGGPTPWWRGHYDVTEAKRREAVLAGAVEINFVEWGEMVAKFRGDRPAAPDTPENTTDDQEGEG